MLLHPVKGSIYSKEANSMLSGKLTLKSDAAQLFLQQIGIDADPFKDLEAFKQACAQANPRYKGNRDLVRFQLEEDTSTWKPEQCRTTMILARELGMFNEKRLEGVADVGLALGGARRSPLHRACYIAEAIARGKADVKILVIAGSTRPINEAEQATVQDFAPGAETEIAICDGAANLIKRKQPDLNVKVVCNDDPRSGNRGVIARVMQEIGSCCPIKSLIACTTGIYRTALMFDLMLARKEYGLEFIDAAGHPSDPEMVFNRTVATYLSECLTTLSKAADAAAVGC